MMGRTRTMTAKEWNEGPLTFFVREVFLFCVSIIN